MTASKLMAACIAATLAMPLIAQRSGSSLACDAVCRPFGVLAQTGEQENTM